VVIISAILFLMGWLIKMFLTFLLGVLVGVSLLGIGEFEGDCGFEIRGGLEKLKWFGDGSE